MSESLLATDKAAAKGLRTSLGLLKKQQMNVAVGDVEKRSEILLHPTRSPTALLIELRQTHKDAKKVGCGTAVISPENRQEVVLDLKSKPAAGICRRLARRFRGSGLRIVTLKVEGEQVERFADSDDDASDAAVAADAAAEAEQDLEAVKDEIRRLAIGIRRFPANDPAGAQALALFGDLVEQLRVKQVPHAAALRELADLVARAPDEKAGPSAHRAAAPPAAAQPAPVRQGVTPLEKFSATLRVAGPDLKAARALPEMDERAELERLLQGLSAAKAAEAYPVAHTLSKQAWGTALKMLGSARLVDDQMTIHGHMDAMATRVMASTFNKGKVEALQKLNPGRTFQQLIDAQDGFAKAPSVAGCDAIASAADAYLTHFDELPGFKTMSKEMKAKQANAQAAKTGARHVKMAMRYKALGAPPWNAQQEMEAAEIEATLAFETGTLIDMTAKRQTQSTEKELKAPMLGGASGASAAFWVKGFDHEQSPGNRNSDDTLFVFKPMTGEPDLYGLPVGGSSPREAMTHAFSKAVKTMTGLDLDCPRTQVVTIAADKIDVPAYNERLAKLRAAPGGHKYNSTPDLDPKAKSFTGSMQRFKPSAGKLSEQTDLDPARVPVEDCHRLALLDILTLNADRHSGNVLVAKEADGTPRLIAIDHGLTFPSGDMLEVRAPDRINNATHGNALLKLPNTYQRLPEWMAQRIDLLDPEAIGAEMAGMRQALADRHPELDMHDKLPDQVIDRAKRTARVLKMAARQLSPAVIQLMLAAENLTLLDAPEEEFEQAATDTIARYAAQADALTALYLHPTMSIENICDALADAGWISWKSNFGTSVENFRKWLATNANQVQDLLSQNPISHAPADYVRP